MSSSEPESNAPSQDKTNSWDSKSSRVVLYDPFNHGLKTDWLTQDEGNFPFSFPLPELANFLENSSVRIQLPRWRNSVDIYIDQTAKVGFVATVKLTRLGKRTNWQRRLRYKHTYLYMKGLGSEEEAYPSATSIWVGPWEAEMIVWT